MAMTGLAALALQQVTSQYLNLLPPKLFPFSRVVAVVGLLVC
jgi:hypothetical protein